MKDSYEIRKFNKYYILWGILLLMGFSAAAYAVLREFTARLWMMIGACFLVEVIIYVIAILELRHICKDVRQATDVMMKLLDNHDIPPEPYEQGELGELYSNLYKLVGALRDSKDKEQEEKNFLRDIMSDISHQLKTPLAALTVFMDLLYDDRVMEDKKRKEIISESKNQLTRMEWMVLSMLKLARIEAGAIQFENVPCNLRELLCRSVEGVTYLTQEREQSVHVSCDGNEQLMCDGDWLVEGIINLLKNASDYSPSNAEIEIEVEKTSMYTRIYVKDNGMGIPDGDLPNIFKRFYRVNKDVNPNSVGIGLSLTKSIVEGMGGKITVRSRLGEYTHFILTFVH
ncbi:MAG: HAMP domain-containing histidine kinase [Clostridium sp.]|nr:HAMP domain-containing histidine kinase [Clostridium sp.]MCM1399805.1 HAMP domain-containing histidine kinase [Clostridium sp.]MCM1459568.1 HAMP domain-containing histidine kinase [Bacteroides sp.]